MEYAQNNASKLSLHEVFTPLVAFRLYSVRSRLYKGVDLTTSTSTVLPGTRSRPVDRLSSTCLLIHTHDVYSSIKTLGTNQNLTPDMRIHVDLLVHLRTSVQQIR